MIRIEGLVSFHVSTEQIIFYDYNSIFRFAGLLNNFDYGKHLILTPLGTFMHLCNPSKSSACDEEAKG